MKKQNKLDIRVNYSWVVLAAGTIGVIMSIPGQTMGVSVFTDFLIENLKLTRTSISTAYMIGTVSSALLLGRAGRFYDKYGAKLTGFIAVASLSLVLLYLSYIDIIRDSLPWVSSAASGAAAFVLLTLGFFTLRFFGQGILAMVSRNMVVKWFDRNRGLVMAFMGGFTTLGFSMAPRFFNSLIDTWDWRGAWRFMSLVLGLGFTVIVLLFYKDWKPENRASDTNKDEKAEIPAPESGLYAKSDSSLEEAIRTKTFWTYNMAIAFFAMFNTAITFHVVSIFDSAGIGRTAAVSIFIPMSVVAVISQIVSSTISDYINLKIILALELAGMIAASAGMILLNPGFPVALIIGGLGLANGTFVALTNLAWIKTFGKTHLGAISGFAMGWTVGGSAIGPFLFSALRDISGDYKLVALISLILLIILFIFSFADKRKKEIHAQ